MQWRKQKREPRDPSWIFSTWPIPRWVNGRSEILVTATDGPPDVQASADYVYTGPGNDRLDEVLARLDSVGYGSLVMTHGTFQLSKPIVLGPSVQAMIVGNRFI